MVLSITELNSPEEVAVAFRAVEQYRRSRTEPQKENTLRARPEVDIQTAAASERILRALQSAPLGPRYRSMIETWYDSPPNEPVTFDALQKAVGATRNELRASLAKLSGRMKPALTAEESATFRVPFLLLADIERAEGNSTKHRLTPAGREAVRKYLKR